MRPSVSFLLIPLLSLACDPTGSEPATGEEKVVEQETKESSDSDLVALEKKLKTDACDKDEALKNANKAAVDELLAGVNGEAFNEWQEKFRNAALCEGEDPDQELIDMRQKILDASCAKDSETLNALVQEGMQLIAGLPVDPECDQANPASKPDAPQCKWTQEFMVAYEGTNCPPAE
jgi:hypothetical protein